MKKNKVLLFATAMVIVAIALQCKPKTSHSDDSSLAKAADLTQAEAVYSLDVAASSIKWTGSKLFEASSHDGTISAKEGKIGYKADAPVAGSVVIDMTTIKNADIKDGEKNAKLVGHLNSDDFFNTAKYTEARFDIVSITKTAAGLEINGNLAIKGKTHAISFDAEVNKNNNKVGLKASLSFDRSKYDVRYGSKTHFIDLAQDKVIDDKVKLDLDLVFNKK